MRTVVLYGNSLAVTAFGAGLRGMPDMRLLPMDAGRPDEMAWLQTLQPDIVMFDLATALPGFAIPLLKVHPELLLIGVDLLKGDILVLAGSREQVLSVTDLVEIIRGERVKRQGASAPSGRR